MRDYLITIRFRADSERDAWRVWSRLRDQLDEDDEWRYMEVSEVAPAFIERVFNTSRGRHQVIPGAFETSTAGGSAAESVDLDPQDSA